MNSKCCVQLCGFTSERYTLTIILVIVSISHMIEFPPVFHYLAIQIAICQSGLAKFRVHQPLQVIKMTAHP